ncbi:TPA: hypothetical protein JIZ13_18135 [Acinetobacter nosocomialis]|uniref:Uncharacterized protein n=1 Tax=Acinetobacter nosocomialis TaxID=106654 RepID=A0A2L1VFC2_ACINO|nr:MULTISPECIES: hypothetical protein [Acinetobacter]AJB47962.1 hypothetical protein RR32_07515 [Acinetobacter nosocomialis]AVF43894.1 hypothetical protein AL533_05600 [Acinetobacter nosocomialis]AWL18918.1 hypothetical protein DIW83_07735 [Acinetobacter nosocomialis]AZC09599.1 hypothetical protein DKE47_008185 [Acinetobacter nosocomialis]ELA7466883.1 hypothetical protein [Acinetobacter nosocomialis]
MKRLITLFLLPYATGTFAQEPFEVSKSCFVVNGKNSTETCLLSSTNNLSSNFERLTFPNSKVFIKESNICSHEDSCISVGSNLSNLKDATIYYRDFKTKKIIEAPEKDSWTCFKQQHDRLDFCVSYN